MNIGLKMWCLEYTQSFSETYLETYFLTQNDPFKNMYEIYLRLTFWPSFLSITLKMWPLKPTQCIKLTTDNANRPTTDRRSMTTTAHSEQRNLYQYWCKKVLKQSCLGALNCAPASFNLFSIEVCIGKLKHNTKSVSVDRIGEDWGKRAITVYVTGVNIAYFFYNFMKNLLSKGNA